jgi:CheY-like chemotaxis protein
VTAVSTSEAPPETLRSRKPSREMKAVRAPEIIEVRLPASMRRPPTPVSLSEEKGAKAILVVEDDDSVRRLIVRALRTAYTVYEASDGEQAADLLDQHPTVDLVVSDIMMPKLSGTGLAKKMRTDARLKTVPIVFVTARTSAADKADGISAGARFYIVKPFSLKLLLEKVGEALGTG